MGIHSEIILSIRKIHQEERTNREKQLKEIKERRDHDRQKLIEELKEVVMEFEGETTADGSKIYFIEADDADKTDDNRWCNFSLMKKPGDVLAEFCVDHSNTLVTFIGDCFYDREAIQYQRRAAALRNDLINLIAKS